MSRNLSEQALESGSFGGSILGTSVAIGGTTEATTDADSLDENGCYIIEDSAGGFYLDRAGRT